jgi:ABC-type multidrug transport system fused ATPase/permease subunit
MVIFPVVLFIGMTMRNKKSIDILFRRNNLQVDLVDSVVETTKDYQLIIDYECRGKFISRFEDGVTKYNAADMSALKLLVNNSYFTPWITTIFVAGYTYVGGQEVIAGSLSLAMYLTNIAVFTQMGAAYNQILNMCVTIQTAFPALLRITRLLNLPSDDNTRMGWTRFQCENSRNIALQSGELKRQGVDTTGLPEFDLLPIRVRDLKLVHYHLVDEGVTSDPSDDVDTSFQFYGNVDLKQGSLISLIGPHSGGKSTLLRVLGGTLLPHLEMVNAGQLFLPCHLRVIHVPSESMFFRGTLLENLTFGCDEDSVSGNDASKERVEAILRMLGLPDCVVDLMDENNMHGLHWLEVVCLSQRFLLAIARALIANPELLCVHKPTEKFSAAEGKRVLSTLKTFVKERGVKKGPLDIGTRPRTCIMTNVSAVAKDYADDMILVSRDSLKRLDESMRKSETLHNLMV